MTTLLTEQEIQDSLTRIPGWEKAGNEIKKKFRLKNFSETLQFVNRIGAIAESMDHHPDILIHGYRYVTLTLSTHSAGGLTQMDFDLALKVEGLAL